MSLLFSSLRSTGHGMSMLFSDGPSHVTTENYGSKSENSVLNLSTNHSDKFLVYRTVFIKADKVRARGNI